MIKPILEIRDKQGRLHFRRWRLFACPWFDVCLHNFQRADKDEHLHDHPWDFVSIVLKGSYIEESEAGPSFRRALSIARKKATDLHKVAFLEAPSVWTLVIRSPRRREWGYKIGSYWVDHRTYREMKNAGSL